MYGIVDTSTGKVFAKDESLVKLQKPFELIKQSYPKRKFILTQVDDKAILVGEDLKKSKVSFSKGG